SATMKAWRFFHQFPTDSASPLRRPGLGFWSPYLADDASNLAATLQTLKEWRLDQELDEVVQTAFPGSSWRCVDDNGQFQVQLLPPGLTRWLNASELSDGTLRFFCLCAVLLNPKPPPLLIFNEPETSLHPDLLPVVARLIAKVTDRTQVLIVT